MFGMKYVIRQVSKPICTMYTKIQIVSGLRNIGLETLELRENSYLLLLLLLHNMTASVV